MKKKVTMKDVAKELGVSTVTVSKALANKEGVSDSVREMIKQKANEMGYHCNQYGNVSNVGVNNIVGILVAEQFMHDSAFYSKMSQTIVKDLMALNYFAILEIITEEAEEGGKLPNVILNNKVDGIIILGQMNKAYIERIDASKKPYILLDFNDDHFNVDTIVSDNFYGAYELTSYLISLGHKEIGFVGTINATTSIMDRYIGYYKAIIQNRLEFREEWVIRDRDSKGNIGEIYLPHEMPTAFVCNCDETAYRLILLLKKYGYRVPEDISVVGYDNYIYATMSNPTITTVEVNVEAMSEAAVNSIINRMKNPSGECGRQIISGRMVIRDSAAAPST
ncbi:LacI family DNA-binding transcriptional regulator [Lachnospiraceae bacterium MD1]|jgi:LacI family transcriptional regulator|uniref:LacI family DNA-binding transcriptional regulator n=1 Tax=Variimorphobacter saccharofermentans TaxID=2755051 RepID=A0A839K370_9FIRM|nr:LacI family DNA-binding transcriptional regulator [Variimorphobacter saccharofermentans]MBB2184070.1 LacI family DNA-binding transcriptional regulator [Variimorphobacter saccharofermentans]